MPQFPPRPDLDQLRAQAKELLRAAKDGDDEARARLAAVSDRQTLATAQLALAREYGLASWSRLKLEIETRLALDSGDLRRVARLLAEEPELARVDLKHWADHPLGVSPLAYVAMLRVTFSGKWRCSCGAMWPARRPWPWGRRAGRRLRVGSCGRRWSGRP